MMRLTGLLRHAPSATDAIGGAALLAGVGVSAGWLLRLPALIPYGALGPAPRRPAAGDRARRGAAAGGGRRAEPRAGGARSRSRPRSRAAARLAQGRQSLPGPDVADRGRRLRR